MNDVQHLTDKAAQVVRVMLAAKHANGAYQWMTITNVTDRAVGLNKATVAAIVGRLSGYGWLETFAAQPSQTATRQYRLSKDGADQACAALAAGHPPQPAKQQARRQLAQSWSADEVVTMSTLEKTAPPEVTEAVRRAMGWDSNNRPVK